VLLWSPAMNFSVHLNYNFPQSNSVYNANGATTTPISSSKVESWNLGFEYNF
jgi:carbonic anhydrase